MNILKNDQRIKDTTEAVNNRRRMSRPWIGMTDRQKGRRDGMLSTLEAMAAQIEKEEAEKKKKRWNKEAPGTHGPGNMELRAQARAEARKKNREKHGRAWLKKKESRENNFKLADDDAEEEVSQQIDTTDHGLSVGDEV